MAEARSIIVSPRLSRESFMIKSFLTSKSWKVITKGIYLIGSGPSVCRQLGSGQERLTFSSFNLFLFTLLEVIHRLKKEIYNIGLRYKPTWTCQTEPTQKVQFWVSLIPKIGSVGQLKETVFCSAIGYFGSVQ